MSITHGETNSSTWEKNFLWGRQGKCLHISQNVEIRGGKSEREGCKVSSYLSGFMAK